MVDDELHHYLTLVRIAENQSAFRAANERIEAGAEQAEIQGPVPFICECPRLRCTEIVRLTVDQYEDARANPVRFFTTPDHQHVSVDVGAARVVEERDGYVLLDKIGVAGEVAREGHDSSVDDAGGGSSGTLRQND